MVKLRLARHGRKGVPMYSIVAADSRAKRGGKFIEKIGQYAPTRNPAILTVEDERALYWLKVGAQPTATVRSLLSKKGIILKFHFDRKGYDEAKRSEIWAKWEASQTEKGDRQQAKKVRRAVKKAKAAEPAAPVAQAAPAPVVEAPPVVETPAAEPTAAE